MPSTQIEVRRPYTDDEAAELIESVHAGMVAGFRIPEDDKHIRLVTHSPGRFTVPSGLTSPDCYTLITIDCYAGRTVDAKRRLYTELVQRLSVLGIPGDHVTIIVRDIPTESWGIRGGHAACDLDLGFDVNV